MIRILKRNGQEVLFQKEKILNAILKANDTVTDVEKLSNSQINQIAEDAAELCRITLHTISVEEIQDFVETYIMKYQKFELAKRYIRYRYKRSLARKASVTDDAILSLIERDNEEVKQENSNKNCTINSVQRDYMAGEVSKDLTMRVLLDEDIATAHKEGIIHFHDADYFAQHMHNCCLVNLQDMLQNGTVISGTLIEKPKSFVTACNIATQIIASVASSQYGGQTFSLAHLAPFVEVSRQKLIDRIQQMMMMNNCFVEKEKIVRMAEYQLGFEISAGIQTIQYQLVTLMTTNGQTPFVSMYIDLNETPVGQLRDDLILLIREVLTQRINGIKNESGVWVTPAFPKLLYVLDENNVRPESEYYELTKLAARCTAKRMVPDYISAKVMRKLKKSNVYPCMGCRSFLTVSDNCRNADGTHKFYGRFNQGVVTINLPDVAFSSERDENKFWLLLSERLELCHKALRKRHERLLGTPSDVAPILWQHGALARLKKGETIDKLLYNGYSTISLGYAGLNECVRYVTGKSYTDPYAIKFAKDVLQALNNACAKWKSAENIDYSVYGTPLESTTYKFAKSLQHRFGVIPGFTDKNYITNSYHMHVTEEIDAFSKLNLEAPFQELSPGGAISYVEVPNMQNNIDAVLALIEYIYDNIMYAELNTKSDYCEVCEFSGEIKIVKDNSGKFIWKCPKCGNTDQSHMYVARRTCGYIGTQFWNQGRTQEIKDRVLHL